MMAKRCLSCRSGSGPLSGQARDDNLHGLSTTAAQAAKPIGPL